MSLATTVKSLSAALLLGAALSACSSESHDDANAQNGPAAAEHENQNKSSSAGLPDGRIAEGEKLANAKGASGQSCVECHGKDGAAPIDPTYPVLAGQYADYISHSLVAYRDGSRDQAVMKTQTESLTDQQIADLGAFFASKSSKITDLSKVK